MGAVNTTYTFTPTDTITSTKMNNIIDETVMTADAVLGGSGGSGGLDISSGKLSISANAINPSRIANNAVTTLAIADGNVTSAKLSTGGPVWTGSTGTITIPQSQLELGTGNQTSTASLIDFHAVYPSTDYEARIVRYAGANAGMAIENKGTSAISVTAPGGVTLASANIPNPVGSAPIFGIRAWVNFDASRDASGAVNSSNTNRLIRSSGNVTSVLKNTTGKFTITFTTAMPDTNYAVVSNSGISPGSPRFSCADRSTATTTTVKIETDGASGAGTDFNENNVMVIA